MQLSQKNKKKIANLFKVLIQMVPFVFMIIVSIFFINDNEAKGNILFLIIKYGLILFDIFALFIIIRKTREFIIILKK